MHSPESDAQLRLDLENQEHTCWDLLNEELRALCARYPGHTDDPSIVVKLQIIGKTYGASIDRKSNVKNSEELYFRYVAPALRNSRIDMLIQRLIGLEPWAPDTLLCSAECHIEIMHAVKHGTGMDNRSFASKYLHFHCPEHVLIYDSHSRLALNAYKASGMCSGGLLSRFNLPGIHGDREYMRHLIDGYHLQERIYQVLGKRVSPRRLDNLLLYGKYGVRRESQ